MLHNLEVLGLRPHLYLPPLQHLLSVFPSLRLPFLFRHTCRDLHLYRMRLTLRIHTRHHLQPPMLRLRLRHHLLRPGLAEMAEEGITYTKQYFLE